MAALRRLNLDGNTVVIFTSDNGSLRGAHGLWGKWIPYEESIRVPPIVRDPRAPVASRGGTRDQMTLNTDIAPTILGLAGLPPAEAMQGRGLGPILQDGKIAGRDDWYYEHTYNPNPPRLPIAPSEAVRTRQWKYARYTKETPAFEQLFDLEKDPGERHNLAGHSAHQLTLAKLRTRCAALRAAVNK